MSFADSEDAYKCISIVIFFVRRGQDVYNDVYKKLLDMGDIIGLTGTLFTTQVGEKTVQVESLYVLSKSALLPLPKTDVWKYL